MVVAPTSKRPRPMRTDLIDVLEEREREKGEEKKGKKEGGVQVRGYSKEEEEEEEEKVK